MKFLILGAAGMAGHTISLYLHEKGHEVTTFAKRELSFCKNIIGDAMDTENLKNTLLEGNYDFVVNCIGLLNKDCDLHPSRAVYLNSFLPHYISDTLKDTNTRVIHMSTDCVFSGKFPPYNEHSFRDGETFYDRTKALGELDDTCNITFRNSIVGPDMKVDGIGLFNWFMKQSNTIQGYKNVIWTGVTTLTLAKAIESVTTQNISGIYNLVNNKSISKFDLLLLFNKHFKNGSLSIIPNYDIKISKILVNNRKDFGFDVPDYETMILEMKEWIENHKHMYPHYYG